MPVLLGLLHGRAPAHLSKPLSGAPSPLLCSHPVYSEHSLQKAGLIPAHPLAWNSLPPGPTPSPPVKIIHFPSLTVCLKCHFFHKACPSLPPEHKIPCLCSARIYRGLSMCKTPLRCLAGHRDESHPEAAAPSVRKSESTWGDKTWRGNTIAGERHMPHNRLPELFTPSLSSFIHSFIHPTVSWEGLIHKNE